LAPSARQPGGAALEEEGPARRCKVSTNVDFSEVLPKFWGKIVGQSELKFM